MTETLKESNAEEKIKKPDVELKLHWGTFCKSITQELDTSETSLIGVLPGLKVAAQVEPGLAEKTIFLPIPLWLHVNFICKNRKSEPSQADLEFSLSINGQVHKQMVPIVIGQAEAPAVLNIRVNTPTGIPLRRGSQVLKASFSYRGEQLGDINLPITADIVAVQPGGKP